MGHGVSRNWRPLVYLAGSRVGPHRAGFMVKPMRMEVASYPGKTATIPLEVRNVYGSDVGAVDLRLVELAQALDGSWRLIEPDSGEDVSGLPSARAWTKLAETSVEIHPLQPATIDVQFSPPADARGTYFVGIIAETPIPENPKGIVVRYDF